MNIQAEPITFKLNHLIQLCQLAKTLSHRELADFTPRLIESAKSIDDLINPKKQS